MYLVDTCVWIDFLRGKNTAKVQFLEALLNDGDAAICEIVYAEICFGHKNESLYKKYTKYFSQIPFLNLKENWHLELARAGFMLKCKGIQPFVADLMVALTAMQHDVPLLTEDKDFNAIAKVLKFDLCEVS